MKVLIIAFMVCSLFSSGPAVGDTSTELLDAANERAISSMARPTVNGFVSAATSEQQEEFEQILDTFIALRLADPRAVALRDLVTVLQANDGFGNPDFGVMDLRGHVMERNEEIYR